MNHEARVPDFEALYRDHNDPWRVASRWYERRKRALLLACLPAERYASAWEPGCGTGHATAALAERVDALVASDGSATAVALTRDLCAGLDHVRVVESALPASPLDGPVQLVVAAEFLYYLSDIDASLATLWDACAPGGHLTVLHWIHHPHDAWRSGEEQHALVADTAAQRGARRLVAHADDHFLLDVYEVAATERTA